MQVDVHEAEKVSDHRFRRRPEPGAQRRAPNQFGGQAFAEVGVARSTRRYWRRQKKSRIREMKMEKMSGRSGECSTERGQVQGAGVLKGGSQRPPPGHSMRGKAG